MVDAGKFNFGMFKYASYMNKTVKEAFTKVAGKDGKVDESEMNKLVGDLGNLVDTAQIKSIFSQYAGDDGVLELSEIPEDIQNTTITDLSSQLLAKKSELNEFQGGADIASSEGTKPPPPYV